MESGAVVLVDEEFGQLTRPDMPNSLEPQVRALPHVTHDHPKHADLRSCRTLIYVDAGE